MFDFDASKLLIIGVVALIVIGPKDLPRVLRQVGQMVGKLRRMAGEFQGQFMDAMKEADFQDLKNEVNKLKDTASLDVDFNPLHDIRSELTQAVGGTSVPRAVNPYGQNPIGVDLPAPAPSAAVTAAAEPVALELAEPAHHTPATAAGAVRAVEAPEGAAAPESAKTSAEPPIGRRRVVVAKRRPPGDRVGTGAPAPSGRGRSLLPPRRDPRP